MVTFNNGDGSAFTLNDSVAGQIKDAVIRGNELVLKSTLSYGAASRSMGGDQKAFMDSTKFLVANMIRSVAKKLEVEMLYGNVGYGVVASATDAPNTVTISTGEFAAGVWAGAEKMPIEIRNAAGTVSRGTFSITAVDIELRKLTLSAGPVAAGVVATDIIWHKGAYGNEFAGLHNILDTTSTIFGIDPSAYSLWKGNEVDAGSAALSFAKINSAVSRAVEKGLDSDVTCLVNPRTWANLLTEQAALRMYDSSYKPEVAEQGSKSIKFHAQNGLLEIVPSIYVKEGYAYIVSMDELSRIGSTDVTFERPGQGDQFFRDLESAAGYELRAYTDQALLCTAPGKCILIRNIVNS